MLKRILSIFYSIRRSLLLRMQKAYISTHVDCKSEPRIKGEVFLNATAVSLGHDVTFFSGAYLWGTNINIGNRVQIGMNTVIFSKKGVTIGNNTSIAGQCYIIDTNHGTKDGQLIQDQADEVAEEGIVIGNDVWIAAQCMILKGAKINDGAVIGAQTLVNCEIPKNAIVVGTPAKIIGYRKK